jgi:hypothetical protein
VRLIEGARAVLQHLHQPRLVERRIGIGRTRQAGHAACHRGGELRFERRLVLQTGLAQPRGQVHQSRRDHQPGGIENAIRSPSCGRAADRRHGAAGDEQRMHAVDAGSRIDQPAVADLDVHAAAALTPPPGCS